MDMKKRKNERANEIGKRTRRVLIESRKGRTVSEQVLGQRTHNIGRIGEEEKRT
jgi:hypothetical protein